MAYAAVREASHVHVHVIALWGGCPADASIGAADSAALTFSIKRTMMMTAKWRGLLAAVAMASVLGVAHAQEVIPVVTGEQWQQSSPEVKKAYLVGLSNAFQVQAAYEAANPPTDAQSIVPRLQKGLRGQTLDGVRSQLDAYYSKNPNMVKRPIVDTIWFEIVVPGLAKAG